jgi:hypothetical protein
MGLRQIETGRPHTYNISTEESYPSTRPRLGDWRDTPSRSSYWGMKRSSTTAAPQAFSNDAYPSPKDRSYCNKYTRGLAVTTQHLEPSWETPSDKASTGRPRWPTPLGLYALAKDVNSMQDRRTYPLRPYKQYPSPGHCCVGSGSRWSLEEGTRGLLAPAGRHRQILQVDRGLTPNRHQVRAGSGVLHQHHPSFWSPELHHHRQWHTIHWEEVSGLLRGPPHPCGLGRRSSPHDEWAGGACQRYDSAGTYIEDLQRPQQVRQAMDERATLGGLGSEDDAELSHGFLAVLSCLWGRGYLTHRLRIRFPEDKGVRRPKQPDQPRRLTGPAGRGSGRGLTTLSAVSTVSAALPRPRGSALSFQVGDLVLRLRQDARGCHKLTPPWEGPFIIAKILKPGTYKLANDRGEVYSNAWNIQQLCRFYP